MDVAINIGLDHNDVPIGAHHLDLFTFTDHVVNSTASELFGDSCVRFVHYANSMIAVPAAGVGKVIVKSPPDAVFVPPKSPTYTDLLLTDEL